MPTGRVESVGLAPEPLSFPRRSSILDSQGRPKGRLSVSRKSSDRCRSCFHIVGSERMGSASEGDPEMARESTEIQESDVAGHWGHGAPTMQRGPDRLVNFSDDAGRSRWPCWCCRSPDSPARRIAVVWVRSCRSFLGDRRRRHLGPQHRDRLDGAPWLFQLLVSYAAR